MKSEGDTYVEGGLQGIVNPASRQPFDSAHQATYPGTMGDPPPAQNGARSRPPSLLACIACRKQHLKCDGQKPLCSRCAARNLDCVWQESRRGYRDYRKPAGTTSEKSHPGSTESTPPPAQQDPSFFGGLYFLDPGVTAGQSYTYDELYQPILDNAVRPGVEMTSIASTVGMPSPGSTATTQSIPNHMLTRQSTEELKESVDLIDTYYKYFHHAHPFVVPRALYHQRPSILPDYLKTVMRLVASHYIPGYNTTALDKACTVILTDQIPDDGFKVQALVLYTIDCFARFKQATGAAAIDKAVQAALRIGLNHQSYAITAAPTDYTMQESWRRTWWSLFLIDGLITAVGGQAQPFRLHSAFCDVPLPDECERYASLQASPTPPALALFRDRTFFEDASTYSSMAYMIEAIYIMGQIFSLSTDSFTVTDPQVEAIDAAISNFLLSLPPSKREIPQTLEGGVDEPLLLAHVVINWAAILLHRPRSTLTFIRNHYATVCTKKEAAGMPALAYASHTSKTLRAADAIISLISIERSLSYCSPCVMCGITVAATVHLPAYAIAENHDHAVAIKERLQLGISALGRFAEIWSQAEIAKSQIAGFAREVLTRPNISVDCSGVGMPSVRQPPQAAITNMSQSQIEYSTDFGLDDEWFQSVTQQRQQQRVDAQVDERNATVSANRSRQPGGKETYGY